MVAEVVMLLTHQRALTHTIHKLRRTITLKNNKLQFLCHACGQQGHKKAECLVQAARSTHLCYVPRTLDTLKEAKHNIDTIVAVKIGGRVFRALVDTGSSQTLVRQECLKDAQTLYKGSLKVWCIHGDEREYPTIDLEMQIEGQGYFLTVDVVDKAPYSVMLGRDVPVIADLLQDKKEVADTRVVTKMQSRKLSDPLPFAEIP